MMTLASTAVHLFRDLRPCSRGGTHALVLWVWDSAVFAIPTSVPTRKPEVIRCTPWTGRGPDLMPKYSFSCT